MNSGTFKNELLYRNLVNNTLQHSIILNGDDYEVFNTALNIACFLMCKNNFCLNCNTCTNIKANNNPDIIVIKKNNDKTEITVDVIKNIKRTISLLPIQSNIKIYIIECAETMNVNAQNALLKSLEEPSDTVKFILCTKDYSKLLPTVLSRCTFYNINGIKGYYDNILNNEIKTNLAVDFLRNILTDNLNSLLVCITDLFKDKSTQQENLTLLKYILKLVIDYKTKKLYYNTILNDSLKIIEFFDINVIFNIYDILLDFEKYVNSNLNSNVSSIYFFIRIKKLLEG